MPHGAVRDDLEPGEVFELGAAHPARQERHDRHVVAPGRRLVRGDPGDVEPRQLPRLKHALQLGGDEDGVTHYLLICARRIESSTAIARAGLHMQAGACLQLYYKWSPARAIAVD